MPIDYNFEITPCFRDLTRSSLLLLHRPVVRSLATLRRLRQGGIIPPERTLLRRAKTFAGVR